MTRPRWRGSAGIRTGAGSSESASPADHTALPSTETVRTKPGPAQRTDGPNADQLAHTLVRVGRRLGMDLSDDQAPPVRPLVQSAARAAAAATLAESLAMGTPWEEAVLATVRALIRGGQWHVARALADTLGRRGDRVLSAVALGVAAHARGWFDLAVQEVADVPDSVLARLAPVEAVESMLGASATHPDPVRLEEIAREAASRSAADVVDVAARLAATGHAPVAHELLDLIDAEARADLDTDHSRTLSLLAETRRRTPVAPNGSVAFGVLDYQQPDQSRASTNLGDYVQTAAMLGHIVRHRNVSFSGEDGLPDVAQELATMVPEGLRIDGPQSRVHLMAVHRDFSSAQVLPPIVWTIAFGWHMHSLFGLRYDFPYHPSVRPLFVSLHINRPEMLTPAALDYLRSHGPIGCRDWSTVDLLLSAGVDAFFTGCLTSTVDAVVPDHAEPLPPGQKIVGLIDAPVRVRANVRREYELVQHALPEVPGMSPAEGVRAAVAALSRYQATYARVITSRLHAYLPATSLGIPTRFVPTDLGDPRFAGLRDMTPQSPDFVSMRRGILDLLEPVVDAILSGASEDDVYALWRSLTAEQVSGARRRHREPVSLSPASFDVDATCNLVVKTTTHARPGGPGLTPVHVALACDHNLVEQLPVTIDAIVTGSSSPVHLYLLTRGLGTDVSERLADAFPDAALTWLPCDPVGYGEVTRMIEHITLSTMDRLLLPSLLPDVDRLVYIDVDALVLGDVAELAAMDLDGRPFAARASFHPGYMYWWTAAHWLPPERADGLRHLMCQRPFSPGATALNAGVLVLDLARLRQDDFTALALAYVEEYGFNDQDVLMAYADGGWARLDPRWNYWPIMEQLSDPEVIHYIGAAKPWDSLVTPYDELWRARASRVAERTGGRILDSPSS